MTQHGTITAGEFAGSTGVGELVAPADLTACTTPEGLTRAQAAYTFHVLL